MEILVDKLVLLLSTDWFDDYWPLIGLQAGNSTRERLRLKCREIVAQIMNGESRYWDISFEDSRIEKTLSLFEESFNNCDVSDNDRKTLMAIASENQDGYLQQFTVEELLDSLLSLLVSETDPEVLKNITPELASRVIYVYEQTQYQQLDFVGISKVAESAWDKNVQSYTPDLPECLADFALRLCQNPTHICRFWVCLKQCSLLNERELLVKWFEETAIDLVGYKPTFPSWMT